MITIIADKYDAAQVLLVDSIMIPFEHPLSVVYTFMQGFCDADAAGSLQVNFNTSCFNIVRYACEIRVHSLHPCRSGCMFLFRPPE